MEDIKFGFAVVLVVFLVYWYVTKYSVCEKKEGMKGGEDNKDVPEMHKSEWGTGKENQERKKREKKVAEDLKSAEDYNQVAQFMSLEPEIYDSHASYVSDLGITDSGASNMSVRSDSNDVVPWVGLRRPNYKNIYAGSDARQVHSENPDQMGDPNHYAINGLDQTY